MLNVKFVLTTANVLSSFLNSPLACKRGKPLVLKHFSPALQLGSFRFVVIDFFISFKRTVVEEHGGETLFPASVASGFGHNALLTFL